MTSVPCLISAEEIAAGVQTLAARITEDYQGKDFVIVGVLKGSFVFMADLVRHIRLPLHCDFVKLSSYGMGTMSSGDVHLQLDVSQPIAGRHVLLIEDVLDTGHSLNTLEKHLQAKQPASLRICVLLDKPSRRQVAVQVQYVGFEIPDRFVVGYGIDHAERYRELPYVGFLPDLGGDTPTEHCRGECP